MSCLAHGVHENGDKSVVVSSGGKVCIDYTHVHVYVDMHTTNIESYCSDSRLHIWLRESGVHGLGSTSSSSLLRGNLEA